MTDLLNNLAPVIDNSSYVGSYLNFFLMLPIVFIAPVVVYGVLLSAVNFLRGI